MEGQLILDRYRPLARIGEGGFGTVVMAWDTRMQRRVAIKRFPLPLDDKGNAHRPAGLAEARTAAMLNHPAIVTVFDFDFDADEAFIIMEYVDGVSLAELPESLDGPLTLDEVAAIVDSVASALDFAHDNGVLHLDIKPENVLITTDGRVKVADFGMSELSSVGGHGVAWGGTPGYMPLEQLDGDRVTHRTDQWALAALAFECLSGRNPLAAESVPAAMALLEADPAPRLTSFAPELPRQLDEVLGAALARDATERYASIAEFADALLDFLGDPDAGHDSLATLASEATDALDDESPGLDSVGVWDRLRGRLGRTTLRLVAAAQAGWLAWTGLVPFSLDLPAALAAVALAAVAGALAPSLGVALGMGFLVAGVFKVGSPVVAVVLALGVGAWWWLLARRSSGASVLPIAGPALAAVSLGPAQPLLAGFALAPLAAGATALLGGVLTFLASAMSVGEPPYITVWAPYALDLYNANLALGSIRTAATSLPAWIALAGWPLAAVIMSAACATATRIGALAGAIAGTAVLGGAYLLAARVAEGTLSAGQWLGNDLRVSLVASLILVLLVAMLGAPVRAEDDDASLPSAQDED